MAFTPYLFFSGDCRDAFTHYQSVLGGSLDILTSADLPPGEEMPGAEPHHVMHAALTIGDALLMGSDDPTGDGGPKLGVSVHYPVDDIETARTVLAGLTEGGRVDMPIEPTFWSTGFGSGVDRFGVSWMIDAGAPEGFPG